MDLLMIVITFHRIASCFVLIKGSFNDFIGWIIRLILSCLIVNFLRVFFTKIFCL